MKEQIEELIHKNKIQRQALDTILVHPESTPEEIEKIMACRRFISGFILELQSIIKN